MKRCPTCEKTFDDAMRFCQTDGTPLVEDAPVDPYKTMIASSTDIAEALSKSNSEKEEDVLQLPAEPEKPTQQEASPSVEEVVDLPEPEKAEPPAPVVATPPAEPTTPPPPPVEATPPPAEPVSPPVFNEPKVKAPDFGNLEASEPEAPATESKPLDDLPFSQTTYPIPSPFGDAPPSFGSPSSYEKAEQPEPEKPSPSSPFDDPEPPTMMAPAVNPFDAPAPAEMSSPVVSYDQMAAQQAGGDLSQSAPPADGQSKGLAVASLVVGILSCLCCFSILTGPIAIILGFIAKGKINGDPVNYGGAGLATGGMVTGAIGFLIGVGLIVIQLFFGGIGAIMNM